MPQIPIVCMSCGATGAVGRVTAGLQCRCGSTDLDINDNLQSTSAGFFDKDYTQEALNAQDAAEAEAAIQSKHPDYDNETNPYPYHKDVEEGRRQALPRGLKPHASLKTAAPKGPGTGWNTTRPDRLQGWDEYQGPAVGHNPLDVSNIVADNGICPACGGSGVDTRASGGGYDEGNNCRLCNGTGRYNPPTSKPQVEQLDPHSGPASGGARWASVQQPNVTVTGNWFGGGGGGNATFSTGATVPVMITYSDGSQWAASGQVTGGRRSTAPLGSPEDYIKGTTPGYGGWAKEPEPGEDYPKADTMSPATRYRQEKDYTHTGAPLKLDQAPCPNCRHQPTELHSNGVWNCPSCGTLANVDDHPEVNPYDPGFAFKPDRSLKVKGSLWRKPKTAKLFKMVASIRETNTGLSVAESLTLARRALIEYPED
jgi:ribosomal protein L37AE/L43A